MNWGEPMNLQEKIDKAMTGLTRCRNQDGLACFGCPYQGERDCLDMAIRDALLILERMRGAIMK